MSTARRVVVATAVALVFATPRSAAARGCRENSESGAVGYLRCGQAYRGWEQSAFGWSGDLVAGPFTRHLGEGAWSGSALGGSSDLFGVALRQGIVRWEFLRFGVWADVGFGTAALRDTGARYGALYGAAGGFIGARASVGYAVLGLDVLGGGSVTRIHPDFYVSASRAVLAPEASVVYYVHPWVAVGVIASANVLAGLDDRSFGLVLRLTGHPYEGTR